MANSTVASQTGLYLYGISPSPAKSVKVGSSGIDGTHAVEPIPCGDFVCWVSTVDPQKFSSALERNVENLDWLAEHGVRHQQAVAEIARQTTIIPARFGTIFSGPQAIEKDVESRKNALKKTLKKIEDSDEWGVKVFAEHSSASSSPAAHATSGREYLQQKAAQLKIRPERDPSAFSDFAAALSEIATGSAPTGKVSGAQPDLVWQATFLVPRKQREKWDNVLQEYVERWSGHRRIEVNGPWPPYSFVADAD